MGPLITLVAALSAASTVSALTAITDDNLKAAVRLWLPCEATRAQAVEEYGPMSDWDVSEVTNMDVIFAGNDYQIGDARTCTACLGMCDGRDTAVDLSKWNVGKVTTMRSMLGFNGDFNGDLSKWNTENVLDMSGMFQQAGEFNADLSKWNVANMWRNGTADMFKDADAMSKDNWPPHPELIALKDKGDDGEYENGKDGDATFSGGPSSKTGGVVWGIIGGLTVVLLAAI